jgi:Mor family transcriptional regulator
MTASKGIKRKWEARAKRIYAARLRGKSWTDLVKSFDMDSKSIRRIFKREQEKANVPQEN